MNSHHTHQQRPKEEKRSLQGGGYGDGGVDHGLNPRKFRPRQGGSSGTLVYTLSIHVFPYPPHTHSHGSPILQGGAPQAGQSEKKKRSARRSLFSYGQDRPRRMVGGVATSNI
jgi:hypothetical protein